MWLRFIVFDVYKGEYLYKFNEYNKNGVFVEFFVWYSICCKWLCDNCELMKDDN